jgi:2-polyprenyl-3-methyl-5-hydroxy-6-metoxy-1,4-benzoquinol methylase
VRVLDIGPHFLSRAIGSLFPAERVRLNTMGWADSRLVPMHLVNKHYEFDLNDAQEQANWPPPEPHDIIIMAEVIEHLYTAPEHVLAMLKTFLVPGGVLLIQTPNAAALDKRWALLRGRNPYEMIRRTRANPGHFREYTGTELKKLCEAAGLRCTRVEYRDYWRAHGVARVLEKFVLSFRRGLTVVCRNHQCR